ncbi:hypothetical protein NDU88_009721 [Pleurodeles waltl]|uniref:Uncharacterized protein n=1 Tax=Pleurodeles waltl TaxID=8319 RepID=A0AAV7PU09_PLEWA|nr:hypothetical protein NDU88_009721 [Pleurodeles waltl]
MKERRADWPACFKPANQARRQRTPQGLKGVQDGTPKNKPPPVLMAPRGSDDMEDLISLWEERIGSSTRADCIAREQIEQAAKEQRLLSEGIAKEPGLQQC